MGKLYVFGSDTANRITVSNKHWEYSVGGSTGWVEKAPMINPGDHVGVAVLGGKVYAVADEHDHGANYIQHNFLSVYDPATDAWKELARMYTPRSHFEGTTFVVNGRIVAVGGRMDNGKVGADLQAYNPVTNSWSSPPSVPEGGQGAAGAFYNGRLYIAGAIWRSLLARSSSRSASMRFGSVMLLAIARRIDSGRRVKRQRSLELDQAPACRYQQQSIMRPPLP